MRRTCAALRSRRSFLAAVSGGLASLYLALSILAVCPVLHRAVHSDAGTAGHYCAITILASGHVETPALGALTIAAVSGPEIQSPVAPSISFAHFNLLPPGRAPPIIA